MKYYKFLLPSGKTPQGHGVWPLPQDDKPGEWLPKLTGRLVMCEHGYHVMRAQDLLSWLCVADLYEVEGKDRVRVWTDKCGARQARTLQKIDTWNDRTARLFAADCAERVMHIYEAVYPNDSRPRNAIQAVRDFANGKITKRKLNAAWAAERKWQSDRLVQYLNGEL